MIVCSGGFTLLLIDGCVASIFFLKIDAWIELRHEKMAKEYVAKLLQQINNMITGYLIMIIYPIGFLLTLTFFKYFGMEPKFICKQHLSSLMKVVPIPTLG